MDLATILVFLAVFLLAYYLLNDDNKNKNLPPGPFSLPLLGSIFFFSKLNKRRPHHVMAEGAKTYGDVMSLWIGPILVVALNGYDAVHEALVKHADVFSGRPLGMGVLKKAFKEDGNLGRGILMNTYCHSLRVLRKFTQQVLRDFGVGRTSIEDKVLTEIEVVSSLLEKEEGNAVDVSMYLHNVVTNVIYGIVFGRRYEYDDAEFETVTRLTREAISGNQISTGNFLPEALVKLIDRETYDLEQIQVRAFQDMRQYVLEQVEEHEATFDGDNVRDFVDLYIKTIRDDTAEDRDVFTKEDMFRVIMDLFLAGSETTSTTLDWAILYMAEYPEVQQRCQREITEAYGNRTLYFADRGKLVYVEACLLEIQRLAIIVPLNGIHNVNKDTTFRGYHIPKGTLIIPSLYSTAYDERYWDNPTEFRPERFIDENGKLIKKEALIPFSTGPRQCIGEALAKTELFLVFANFLQRFTFEPENPAVKHTFESRLQQTTNVPLPYKVRVNKRHNV